MAEKTKQTKTKPVPEPHRQQVDDWLLRIGTREIARDAALLEMNRQIDEVKARFAPKIEEEQGGISMLVLAFERFVRDKRRELLAGKGKTIGTLMGKCGFRVSPERVALVRGTSEEEAIQLLQANMLDHLIRIRRVVSREAVQQRFSDGEVTEELLHRCGITIRQGAETFWHKVDHASVEDELKNR